MKIVGLMLVRNEADILRINLSHHLAAGVDEFLIVDNGSSDGSQLILEELAKDGRVHCRRDDGDYRQAEITTELAREAFAKGADWVIPIDADEFWYAPRGNLRSVLERSQASGIEVPVTNFIQQRRQLVAEPGVLLHMTHRTAVPAGSLKWIRDLVESNDYSYVEVSFPSKWISRASGSSEITMGNHDLGDLSAPAESTDEIVCLHAPLRSRSILDSKVEQGRRVAALGLGRVYGWHVQRWSRIAEEGELEKEWAANSYADQALDVYGERHPVVYDPRLRDVVRPWVEAESAKGVEAEAGKARRSTTFETARTPLVPVDSAAEQLPDSVDGLRGQLHSLRQERRELLKTIQLQCSAAPAERERATKRLSGDLSLRDRTILDLGNELHAKVGDRDKTIRSLQQELHQKVGVANQTIGNLQRELQGKVTEADQTTQALRAEIEEKLGEANRLMDETVGERDGTISSLEEHIVRVTREREHTLDKLKAEHGRERARWEGERVEQENKITALYNELGHIKESKTWRLLAFCLRIRRKLL